MSSTESTGESEETIDISSESGVTTSDFESTDVGEDVDVENSNGLKPSQKKIVLIVFSGFIVLVFLSIVAISFLILFLFLFKKKKVFDFSGFADSSKYYLLNDQKIEFVDAHGHIFNGSYVPSDVIPNYLFGVKDHENENEWNKVMTYVERLSSRMVKINMPSWIKTSKLQFLETFSKDSMSILTKWFYNIHAQLDRAQFSSGAEGAVIVLPVDMDLGYKFKHIPYIDQFLMTKYTCEAYNQIEPADSRTKKGVALFGFSLDPRKLEGLSELLSPPKGYTPGISEKESREYAKYLQFAIESGAVVAKVYPSMGFLPTHPILMNHIWPEFEKVGIPVYAHCSGEGIQFSGKSMTYLDPSSPKGFRERTFNSPKEKGQFSHPQQWVPVIKRFPNLKINFAHFGGGRMVYPDPDEEDESIEMSSAVSNEDDWDEQIIEMMKSTSPKNNVHADVSYFWTRNQFQEILTRIEKEGIEGRVIFGTDYYISLIDSSPKKILRKFFDVCKSLDNWPTIGSKLGKENIVEFLTPNNNKKKIPRFKKNWSRPKKYESSEGYFSNKLLT